MGEKKHDTKSEEPFLNAAARALGSTLGKLAAKTGLAREVRPLKTPASPSPRKKKTAAKTAKAAKAARKPVAKADSTKKRIGPKTKRAATKTTR
jgi:hypothetical protein